MSPFIIPVLGITCGIIAMFGIFILRPWLRLRERELEVQSQQTAEKAAQYAAHTERLEQRVRVLERIVTDKGADLAGEIEQLRDDRVN